MRRYGLCQFVSEAQRFDIVLPYIMTISRDDDHFGQVVDAWRIVYTLGNIDSIDIRQVPVQDHKIKRRVTVTLHEFNSSFPVFTALDVEFQHSQILGEHQSVSLTVGNEERSLSNQTLRKPGGILGQRRQTKSRCKPETASMTRVTVHTDVTAHSFDQLSGYDQA